MGGMIKMSEKETEIIATIFFYQGDTPQIKVYATKEAVPKFYVGTCNGVPFLHVVYISKSDGHIIKEFRIAGTFTILIWGGLKPYPEECDKKENDQNEKGKL
jgi:hypothetical protein